MEERFDEGIIFGAKKMEPIKGGILEKQAKCICKITGSNSQIGTGFFCKIPYSNQEEKMPVLITNYHIIDDKFLENKKLLKLSIDNNLKVLSIDENSKLYSSPRNEYDIMIIKLSKQDLDEFKNYLELESSLFNKDSEKLFQDEPIYILHYPNNDEISVSYGVGIEKINEFDIKHLCNTCNGSSGSPIFQSLTHKVIGIHKGFVNKKNKNDKFNIGTFLKFPLNELFESKNYFSKSPNKSDIVPIKELMSSYNKLRKEIKILVLGLDYSGKTQLVDYLFGTNRAGPGTPGVQGISFEYLGINLNLYDLGGIGFFRKYWKYYYKGTTAIIFMINASHEARIGEAKVYFQELLKDKDLINVPILTYSNFSDLENCLGPGEIVDELEMNDVVGRHWAVYACSAWKGDGINDGMRWLFEKLSE